jgi:uncharacterized membrane protein YhiD involved in acid resistance
MTDKDLGRALLDLDSQTLGGLSDPRERTWKIIEGDRRRVFWWTAAAVALWGAAICMVVAMLVAFALIFPLQAKLNQPEEAARLTPEMLEMAKTKSHVAFEMATVGVTCSVGLLALAALATVFLVLATRRATLRQINASLLEISQQLKELRGLQQPR